MCTGVVPAADGSDIGTPPRSTLSSRLWREYASNAALRDTAARLLRSVPGDDAGELALLRALREDTAWNVRYAALETLVSRGGPVVRDAALEAGDQDGDKRVRALAAELGSKR